MAAPVVHGAARRARQAERKATIIDVRTVPLPIEDRYNDQVSAEDSKAFGLHTGKTEYLRVLAAEPTDEAGIKSVVGEMKVNTRRLGIALAASCAAIASLVALYV